MRRHSKGCCRVWHRNCISAAEDLCLLGPVIGVRYEAVSNGFDESTRYVAAEGMLANQYINVCFPKHVLLHKGVHLPSNPPNPSSIIQVSSLFDKIPRDMSSQEISSQV